MALNRRPVVGIGALLLRAVVAVGAGSVLLSVDDVVGVPAVVLIVGAVLAMVRPTSIGAWVAIPAAAWLFAAGTPSDVGDGRVVLALLGVYLLHTGAAAAATCPVAARLQPEVAVRWLVRCLPAVVLAAVVLGVDGLLRRSPDSRLFLTVAGLLVVVAVVSLVRLLAATRNGVGASHG